MGNKDYTDWNGRKRKLERQYAENEAKQKEGQPKKSKKNKKGGGVAQRLNRAELLVCDLCKCLARYVEQEELRLEDKKPNIDDIRNWWSKWHLSDAESLIKRAEALMKEEGV